MKYDFTSHVNRRGVGSEKWDEMLEENPAVPTDVVPLSVADMEFPNAPEVRRALHELIDAGPLGYAGPTDRFFSSCIDWQVRMHGWRPEREWAVTVPGVVPALFNAVRKLTSEGEGVIIQPPVYYPFRMAIESCGRTVIENPLKVIDGRYEIDFDDLEAKASAQGARMMILCSPHNPVGRVWSVAELRRVVDICTAHDILLVADEIHNDIIMPGNTHTTVMSVMSSDEAQRLIVCTAPSKTFNLAGCQCSVIYIPNKDIRDRFRAGFHRMGMESLNIFAYAAAEAAYDRCGSWLTQLIDVVWTNFSTLVNWVAQEHPELDVYELQGTYLAWVDFRAWGLEPDELKRFMREEALLWLDEGEIFGAQGAGFERFNLACPADVLERSLERLDAAAKARGFAQR